MAPFDSFIKKKFRGRKPRLHLRPRSLGESLTQRLSPIWRKFKLEAKDGKLRLTDCANKEGLLRVIQSIPSKKAEPFKLWLANVGSQFLDEKTNKRLVARRKLKEK